MNQINGRLATLARDDARRLKQAQALALGLSDLWPKARKAPPGPIDVVDLFSGCGGMSAGFLAVNALAPAYRLALAIDLDCDSNRSYELNLGVRPLRADIVALARSPKVVRARVVEARSAPNSPLVLIGCAPCQGFSSHRNAEGEHDVRNSLFVAFARIAAAVQPDAVVVENVPEILTDRYWPFIDEARQILGRAGYRSILSVHDMAAFGVPQHRFRAVMIAMRRRFRMPQGFLAQEKFRTVRHAIGHLPSIAPGQIAESDPMHFTAAHRSSTVDTIRAVPSDGGSRPWHAGPECLRRAEARQGRAAYEDVYGRLWWDRPSITITAYARNPASGRYVHPDQHRGLSVREAALLQSFPGQYRFEGSFDSRFRQIGNAVPPAFASYLAMHLLGELARVGDPLEEPVDIRKPLGPSFSRMIPALKAGHRHLPGVASQLSRSERVRASA